MATFNDYLNDYKTATAKESAAERAKRIQQDLARAKKLKFAAKNELFLSLIQLYAGLLYLQGELKSSALLSYKQRFFFIVTIF